LKKNKNFDSCKSIILGSDVTGKWLKN
jgi:hypothetical protein